MTDDELQETSMSDDHQTGRHGLTAGEAAHTHGPFDVGTTTLLAELLDIHNSIKHQVSNSCEKRAAEWIVVLLQDRALLLAALHDIHNTAETAIRNLWAVEKTWTAEQEQNK